MMGYEDFDLLGPEIGVTTITADGNERIEGEL
jgi:hypothetical protein